MSENVDRELTLHYIDKVHTSLLETGQSINRSIVSLALLVVIILALSSGIVSVNQNISLGGFNFNVSISIVLTGGAWAIGLLFIYILGLDYHDSILRDTILRLYKSLGFSDESMFDLESNSLEFPNILTITLNTKRMPSYFLGKAIYIISLILAFSFFLIGPIIAQIIAGYKMVLLYGATWWIWLSFSLIVLITVSRLVSFLKFSTRN